MRRTIAIVVALLMLVPATALAEVTRDELDEALAKVREVSRQLDGELTDLDRSIGLETSYEDRIRVIEQQLLDRQREVVMMELLAKERVQAMYMNAGTNRFQTVLSVEEFGQVGTRTAYLDTLADQEIDVVNQLLFLQNDSVRLQAELETLLSDQSLAVERLEDSSSDIYDTLQIANDEYQVVYSEWQKQEAARRAREEAARQRAIAAAAAAAAAETNYTSSAGTSPKGRTCPVAGAHSFRDSWGEPRPGGRQHHGTDLIAPTGTPLVAIESGYIWSMSWHVDGGNGIYVKGNSGDIYYYAHLDSYATGMRQGVRVDKGQVIGYVGDTGNAKGTPHLHLGYRPGGGPLTNPYQLMVKLCR